MGSLFEDHIEVPEPPPSRAPLPRVGDYQATTPAPTSSPVSQAVAALLVVALLVAIACSPAVVIATWQALL